MNLKKLKAFFMKFWKFDGRKISQSKRPLSKDIWSFVVLVEQLSNFFQEVLESSAKLAA
jgi:hypothetical protein